MIRFVPLAVVALLAAIGRLHACARRAGRGAASTLSRPGDPLQRGRQQPLRARPAGTMKPERLDRLVDDLADSQVTVMLICCNAKNTGLREPRVGRPRPRVRPGPRQPAALLRRHAPGRTATPSAAGRTTSSSCLEPGVDPMQRMIDRCRLKRDQPVGEHPDERRARCPPRPLAPAQPLLARPPRLLALPRPVHRVERPLPELRPRAGARPRDGPDPRGAASATTSTAWNLTGTASRSTSGKARSSRRGSVLTEWMAEVRRVVRRGGEGGGSTRSAWPRGFPPGPRWRKARGWTP